MKNFQWTEPQTVEQALAWLAKANGKAVLMACGTDLFTEIKEGGVEAGLVIDLKATLGRGPRGGSPGDAQMPGRKKGGSQCFAAKGKNKYHAIFGGGVCHIVYPSDLAPMLIALDAQVTISSPRGERSIPLAQFYAMPAKKLRREDILTPDELVRAGKRHLANQGN